MSEAEYPTELRERPPRSTEPTQRTTWLLAGASKSGKTYFLSALQDARIEVEARETMPGIDNLDFKFSQDERLQRAAVQRQILKEGVLSATSGDELLRYSCKIRVDFDRSQINGAEAGNALPENLDVTEVTLLDGPGGGMFPPIDELDISEDSALSSFKDVFRNAVQEATGVLLFLPTQKRSSDAEFHVRSQIISFLEEIWDGKYLSIKRIAVCMSKYESKFKHDGQYAQEKAGEKDNISQSWRDIDPGNRYLETLKDCHERQNIDIQIFPISAFGFIGDTGFPNLVEHNIRGEDKQLPLILAPQPDVRVGKLEVPLYPRPFSASDVDELHKPFNLAAPLVFLATGYTGREMYKKRSIMNLYNELVKSGNSPGPHATQDTQHQAVPSDLTMDNE